MYWVLFLAKSIMYYRSMDVHGLIGYIGGYIGLFVGYSVLQIPDTILILKGKCEKLYLKARNYNSYWKEEKSCDWSDAVQVLPKRIITLYIEFIVLTLYVGNDVDINIR